MRFDKFTIKVQEAIQASQSIAEGMGHQQIEPEHLLTALVNQPDNVLIPLLEKVGIHGNQFKNVLKEQLDRMPRVSGTGLGQTYISPRLKNVLDRSFQEASQLRDEYVSMEHILLALMDQKGDPLTQALIALGLNREVILRSLKEIRGSQRVTDPNPEDKYRPLEKFARDLTDLARQGKLDPVIGRDDEIRRVIQVLSRRTKNNPVLIGEPGVGKTAIVEGLAQSASSKGMCPRV
jgi:ATP-dependent Clp protease ATP-binding subunit ClpB